MTKEAIRYVKDGWSSSTEDRNLENVLKNPENYVDSYSYGLRIVQMLRQKAFRDMQKQEWPV